MASGEAEHDANLQKMVDAQVERLQAALRETMAIAAKQGCGVTVVWDKNGGPENEMKVEMFVDPELAVDEVRYRNS